MYCNNCQRHHSGACALLEVELIEESRLNRGYGMSGSLGVDVTDDDLVGNLGGGLGIDLGTGQVEVDLGGFDFPI